MIDRKIIIYADGACRGNGAERNLGAYAYVLQFCGKEKECAVACENTTNNQMELMAVIQALYALKPTAMDYQIEVYSDSQYVVRGVNEWSKKWIKNDFTGVKNPELWRTLLLKIDTFPYIKFYWVKGHASDNLNERVDSLCNIAMDDFERGKAN